MGYRNSDDNCHSWVWGLFLVFVLIMSVHKGQSEARKTAMRAQNGVANVHIKDSMALTSPADSSCVKKAPMKTGADVNDVKTHTLPEFT